MERDDGMFDVGGVESACSPEKLRQENGWNPGVEDQPGQQWNSIFEKGFHIWTGFNVCVC